MYPIHRGLLAIALFLPLGAAVLPHAGATPKKTVAVIDFDNHSDDDDYDQLGKGIAAMLVSDLSVVESIQLVERQRLRDLMDELFIQQGEYFDPATAGKIGRFVGAQYVVVGAITAVHPDLRIDTRVLRVETGEIVKTAAAQGREEKFFALQKRLSDQLIEGLELALSPEQAEKLRRQQEKNRIREVRTALRFSQALQAMDNEDYVRAVELMGPVMKEAPGSELFKAAYSVMKKKAAAAGANKLRDKLRGIIR